MTSHREVLIDAIMGKGFPDIHYAIEMEKAGFAKFSGDQWNEDWEWKREKLETLNAAQLQTIYER